MTVARFFQAKAKTSKIIKHLSLTISHLDNRGAGIAYDNGQTIFVKGALAGEQVVAHCYQQKDKIAHASIVKLLKVSPDRIKPICPYYATTAVTEQCGGCHLQHLDYQNQLLYKQNLTKKQFNKQQIETIYDQSLGYRRCTRLSFIELKHGEFKLGFRQQQRVIPINHCSVLTESLDVLLMPLQQCISQLQQRYKIGHIELIEGDNQVAVMIHQINLLSVPDRQLLINFAQQQQCALFLSVKDMVAIEQLVGHELSYQVANTEIRIQPNHFIQVNRLINQKIVKKAIQWLDLNENDVVLDLFCGVGNFSFAMAKQVNWLIGVEGIPNMVEQCHQNAKHNDCNNIDFYAADLNDSSIEPIWLQKLNDICNRRKLKITKILLDPARAGAFELMRSLEKLTPALILYVSCHPASFENDLRQLQQYKLTQLCLIDMFPQTYHRELMGLFKR